MSPKDDLKEKFKTYDKNGDGNLDFNELCGLLRQGHPNFTDKEVHTLFCKVDKDNSGSVSFEEFVDFIHAEPMLKGRREKDTAVGDDGNEGDWEAVKASFAGYAGKDMVLDGREFAKIMVDCKLYDKKFTKNDVDIIFAKIVVKGKRKVGFEEFKNGLRHVAKKKEVATSAVQATVGASSGPVLHATKADAVKFHDDKSTYTGAHTGNEKHAGADQAGESEGARHERLANASAAKVDAGSEGDWAPVQAAFNAFTGGKGMDGRMFAKLCADCNLFDKKFSKNDVDIVFASVCPKGHRTLEVGQFEDALRKVAAKKGVPTSAVQVSVGDSGGPVLHGTKTDDVRFHDDKSTYTGAHAS